jgi:hypothetical protein
VEELQSLVNFSSLSLGQHTRTPAPAQDDPNTLARVALPTFAQQTLPKKLTEAKSGGSLKAGVYGRGRFVLRRASSAAEAVEAREQVQAAMPGFERAAACGNLLTSSTRERGALPASKGTLSFAVF